MAKLSLLACALHASTALASPWSFGARRRDASPGDVPLAYGSHGGEWSSSGDTGSWGELSSSLEASTPASISPYGQSSSSSASPWGYGGLSSTCTATTVTEMVSAVETVSASGSTSISTVYITASAIPASTVTSYVTQSEAASTATVLGSCTPVGPITAASCTPTTAYITESAASTNVTITATQTVIQTATAYITAPGSLQTVTQEETYSKTFYNNATLTKTSVLTAPGESTPSKLEDIILLTPSFRHYHHIYRYCSRDDSHGILD